MLEIKNVKKTFYPSTLNEKKALCGIDLTLNKGDFVTMIGSNGAGKSTLFNAICGNFRIDSGKVILDNKDISKLPFHKRAYDIGRLFQDTLMGTAPNMTIEENLAIAYTRKAKASFFAVNKRDNAEFYELIKRLDIGLENRMKTKVGQLSGGQRQAITLLMATISKPKLLLLDEHTAALDPETAKKILKITTELVEESSITTMMITHDINAALSIGNRTIMMDSGKIILDISGKERENMTIEKLLECYSKESKKKLANDRMLFS